MENSVNYKKNFGSWGEQLAADYLYNLGYEIVCRNYRCRYGELDLVCRLKTVWCFVEVKTRKSLQYGGGLEAITLPKQKHLRRCAYYYLNEHHLEDVAARFDIVAITYTSAVDYRISLVQNAF